MATYKGAKRLNYNPYGSLGVAPSTAKKINQAWVTQLTPKYTNPYGTLGPSPARVANVNSDIVARAFRPPQTQIKTPAPTPGQAKKFIDIGAVNPDYRSGIEGDWEYLAALADMDAMDAAETAQTQEGINALAVGLGGDLSSLVSQGLIGRDVADQASKNEFSTMKEFDRALGRQTVQGNDQLAGAGTLNSGAMGVFQSALNEDYQRQTTRALQQAINDIKGMRSNLATSKAGRRSSLANVRASVAQRLAGMAQYQSYGQARATWDPDYGAYVDTYGRFFDQNGTRIG